MSVMAIFHQLIRSSSNTFVNIGETRFVRTVTVGCGMRHMAHATLQPILRLLLADEVSLMADDAASANLQHVLEQRSERVCKPRSTVLFRRGDKASGMFVVLSGKVSLDLGVDSALCRTYGPGALVGLPSTVTRRNYSMTATVTEDAELGFWSPDALDSLLRKHPDLCPPLLAILGAKIAENHEVERALLTRDKQPAM